MCVCVQYLSFFQLPHDRHAINLVQFIPSSKCIVLVPFLFHDTWTARVDDVSEFNFLFKPSIIYNILIQDTLFTLCSSDLHPSKYQVCVARGIGVTFVLK